MTLATTFRHYVDRPSPQTLAALHDDIVSLPDFTRATEWQSRADDLLAQARHDEVIRWVSDHMPGALLCVAAHRMLSHSHDQIGDTERSRRESFLADLAIKAILDSGTGTESSPWRVLHVTDEYATLRVLGVDAVAQRSRRSSSGEIVDIIDTSDGEPRWFTLI